jgi:hypothetical protein
MIDFTLLKSIYNNQMDMLLAQTGLATQCSLNFGTTKKDICPNCIYDVNLKKSANKYKSGGPIPFNAGQICPYCNGVGFYGETTKETVYLAIIWDYKKWINPPVNAALPDGMIQTISDITTLQKIRKCKDMDVIYPSSSNKNHKFQLDGEPTPAGLGDNNYIICMWKKIN